MRGFGGFGRLDPGWARALEPVTGEIAQIEERLEVEAASGAGFMPAREQVLRAFQLPLDDVRVLIVGQDPYPTVGHPIGLSFATDRHVRPLPRSLANIYRELRDDLGIEPAATGDLSRWSEQGVLLLNRVLTVRPGAAGSHRGFGWQTVTDAAIEALVARNRPLVALLWGKDAQALAPLLGSTPRVESPHPSPLSASRGFFGSRPFSKVNELLRQQGADPIDWRVETADALGSQPHLF
ncbi:uracil-DNA glycosylase [Pseudoclavibacter sp. AY1F1]|uniref:uracil-DNA glycosylase n=1 Tax=Pseudoclavibacter sp. AY1F1 TaxID=2080583 RepID=UPI002157168F|nr:uracil-DNA glycosylase [Pseudoclavibacter sp. AY1F1]